MSSATPIVHLRPGHVQPLWAGHPWVYAQAIARVESTRPPQPGDLVAIVDPHGQPIGRGFWSARPAIPVRIVSRDPGESLDGGEWIEARLRAAIARRRLGDLPDAAPPGYRLLHAEGDGVPGLVVDVFGVEVAGATGADGRAAGPGRGGVVVVQVGTAGLRRRGAALIGALERVLQPRAILDRTAPGVGAQEGFTLDRALERGGPIDALRFRERGLDFTIPIDLVQKTGFYFDQRPLRARIEQLAAGRRVLDAFCYVGPIAIGAARGGATAVTALDDSLRAIEVGAACAKANGVAVSFVRADVRRELPRLAEQGARFDLVILDPPKLAPTRAARDGAVQYQTRLVQEAAALVEPGGLVVVCSCSSAVGPTELGRALAIGARRAGRSATVIERLGQGADHPVPAAFPEGVYLSTLVAELGAAS
ncbi:MAG: class I SAM-dependent rRNA methyltransferase [Polyangiales bacterium]